MLPLLLCIVLMAPAGFASIPDPGARVFAERPAAGKFLIASESIRDPRFRESVILLLSHDEQGTLGVIVNRPTRIPLSDVTGGDAPGRLYFGGPVQPSVFSLLVDGGPGDGEDDEGRSFVLDSVWFVFGTEAVLDRLGRLGDGRDARVYAGYAGWAPGQLEAELRDGGWHLLAANPDAIFSADPGHVWESLMRRVRGHWI